MFGLGLARARFGTGGGGALGVTRGGGCGGRGGCGAVGVRVPLEVTRAL